MQTAQLTVLLVYASHFAFFLQSQSRYYVTLYTLTCRPLEKIYRTRYDNKSFTMVLYHSHEFRDTRIFWDSYIASSCMSGHVCREEFHTFSPDTIVLMEGVAEPTWFFSRNSCVMKLFVITFHVILLTFLVARERKNIQTQKSSVEQ